MQLNQVTVSATDIERSVSFYKLLGLQLIVHSPHYARFIVKGNNATFSIHIADEVKPSQTIVYFECDDVDATYKDLTAKGINFESEPVDQTWLWREAYCKDPDGNLLCLYHAGENRLNPPWRITDSL